MQFLRQAVASVVIALVSGAWQNAQAQCEQCCRQGTDGCWACVEGTRGCIPNRQNYGYYLPTWRKWPGVPSQRAKPAPKKLPVELPPADVPSSDEDSPVAPESQGGPSTKSTKTVTPRRATIPASRHQELREPPDPPEPPLLLPEPRPGDQLPVLLPADNAAVPTASAKKETEILLVADRPVDEMAARRSQTTHAMFVADGTKRRHENAHFVNPQPDDLGERVPQLKAIGETTPPLKIRNESRGDEARSRQEVKKPGRTDRLPDKATANSVKKRPSGTVTSPVVAGKQSVQKVQQRPREIPTTGRSVTTGPSRSNQLRFAERVQKQLRGAR